MIRRFEKEGLIKEYTIIPDFAKLGMEIMAIDFAKLNEPIEEKRMIEITKQLSKTIMKEPLSRAIMATQCMGVDSDRVIITFHEDYSSYRNCLQDIRQNPYESITPSGSFLINLKYQSHYLPSAITFSKLAEFIGSKASDTTK
jgi:DNA-binding Lrp family transcriptional regulator